MAMTQIFHSVTMTQCRCPAMAAWVVQSVMRRQCFWRETIGQMLFFLMLFVSLHSPSLHTKHSEHSFQYVLTFEGNFVSFGCPPFARCCYITVDSATTALQNGTAPPSTLYRESIQFSSCFEGNFVSFGCPRLQGAAT
jgi:hypothetical protein